MLLLLLPLPIPFAGHKEHTLSVRIRSNKQWLRGRVAIADHLGTYVARSRVLVKGLEHNPDRAKVPVNVPKPYSGVSCKLLPAAHALMWSPDGRALLHWHTAIISYFARRQLHVSASTA